MDGRTSSPSRTCGRLKPARASTCRISRSVQQTLYTVSRWYRHSLPAELGGIVHRIDVLSTTGQVQRRPAAATRRPDVVQLPPQHLTARGPVHLVHPRQQLVVEASEKPIRSVLIGCHATVRRSIW